MAITTVNPATGENIQTYDVIGEDQVNDILTNMEKVRREWMTTDLDHRATLMRKVGDVLRNKKQEFAAIITNEMGKPITQAISEIEKCATLCDYYADKTPEIIADEIVETEASKSFVCYRPLGIIFAIMPWNFPFWQVMRFAVPNLMAGNAGVLKHAKISMGAAVAIESIFLEAGFPEGLFRSLIIETKLAEKVINNPLVHGVTLTGSNRAGQIVASQAGHAMKKVVLELGGSDPAVVLEDADLELAAEQIVTSRLANCGQVCISAKRVIAVEPVIEKLTQLILEKAKAYVFADPMDPNTKLGPMARADLRAELHEQVERTIAAGGECLLGGELPEGKGSFYPATVITNITEDSPAFKEELFGPVIGITVAKDEADAIRLANDTIFGLGAVVFTQDIEKGTRIAADQLEAGSCNVNKLVGSDPRMPFGGIKQSGFGRELASEGMHEFMNIKSVVVA